MKKLLTILLILLTSACGFNGTQKIQTNDSKFSVGGAAYLYVSVRMEFIQDVKDLCEAQNLRSDYASDELYDQAVANCVFENLSILDINLDPIGQFQDQLCDPSNDLSGFTPEEQADIIATCEALGIDMSGALL